MENPVAGRRRKERKGQRAADRYDPHVLQWLQRSGHHRIRARAAGTCDAKIKAVKVKRVFDRRGVDDAEVNRITLSEVQALVVRPRFSVEGQGRLECLRLGKGVKPLCDQPHPLPIRRCRCARRIHDECAVELRIEPFAIREVERPLSPAQ
jgi:hypothetical protein